MQTTTFLTKNVFIILLLPFKKIGPQCELVWDFSQIKVDVLWIIMKNYSFTVNTGAHYFFYTCTLSCCSDEYGVMISRSHGYKTPSGRRKKKRLQEKHVWTLVSRNSLS